MKRDTIRKAKKTELRVKKIAQEQSNHTQNNMMKRMRADFDQKLVVLKIARDKACRSAEERERSLLSEQSKA